MLKIIHTLLFTIILITQAFAANDIEFELAFEPSELSLGRRGLLNVTVSGIQNTAAPNLPTVDGLIIRSLGSQQSIQMINGKTSMHLTFSFTVTPQRAGEFTIPSFDWDINGKKYPVSSPTSKLKVLPQGTPPADQDSQALNLKIDLSKNNIFVGQMLPINISLHVPMNLPARIITNPTIESNDFINYGYKNDPTVNIEVIDGIKKQVASYQSYITPLKSGDLTIQYIMSLLVQRPRTSINQSRMSGNNFFDSLFGSAIISHTEEVDISSVPTSIKVNPLPTQGKPDSFTGAIGEFKIESISATPEKAQVGDPITLKMAISGSGNFERISPPALDIKGNWKSYTPKSIFNTKDDFGFTGTKVFEYIIIPQDDRINETPTITFSFFNPQTGLYSELISNPIALEITPASETPITSFPGSPIPTSNITQSAPKEPELLPIKLEITHSVKTQRPLMTLPFFMPSLLGVTILIAGLLTLIKKQKLKRKKDAEYLRRIRIEKAIQHNLQKVKQAYAKRSAKEFYHAATHVLLEIVAKEHQRSSQSLQAEEVINFFKEKHLSEDSLSFINTLFQTADILKFSGVQNNNNQNLNPEIFSKFESLINELEKCC